MIIFRLKIIKFTVFNNFSRSKHLITSFSFEWWCYRRNALNLHIEEEERERELVTQRTHSMSSNTLDFFCKLSISFTHAYSNSSNLSRLNLNAKLNIFTFLMIFCSTAYKRWISISPCIRMCVLENEYNKVICYEAWIYVSTFSQRAVNTLVKDPMQHSSRPWCDFCKQTVDWTIESAWDWTQKYLMFLYPEYSRIMVHNYKMWYGWKTKCAVVKCGIYEYNLDNAMMNQ